MSRNGSGTYSLPVPPFTPGTVILSADVNSDFSDIATALTGSIAADGQTPITGQLRGSQASAPTYSITGDLNTGFGSSSADSAYIQCGGINIVACTTVGATITGTAAITGTLTVTGDTTFGNILTPLTVLSTDAGAAVGPTLDLFRDSASPAVSDLLGIIEFNGRDSAGNKQLYVRVASQITDPVSTTEDANLFLQAVVAGTLTTVLQSSGADITIPGNLTVTGNITDKNPTVQSFTASGAATYTPTTGTVRVRVRMIGGAGGGGARITNNGSPGGTTNYGSWTAIGGNGGTAGGGATAPGGAGGSGGATGTGTLIARFAGSGGNAGNTGAASGAGGSSPFGGAGSATNTNSNAGITNSGSGGSGGAGAAVGTTNGGGGGAGEYVEFWVNAPIAIGVTVGALGAGGTAGTTAGGAGGSGIIIIEEFYS